MAKFMFWFIWGLAGGTLGYEVLLVYGQWGLGQAVWATVAFPFTMFAMPVMATNFDPPNFIPIILTANLAIHWLTLQELRKHAKTEEQARMSSYLKAVLLEIHRAKPLSPQAASEWFRFLEPFLSETIAVLGGRLSNQTALVSIDFLVNIYEVLNELDVPMPDRYGNDVILTDRLVQLQRLASTGNIEVARNKG